MLLDLFDILFALIIWYLLVFNLALNPPRVFGKVEPFKLFPSRQLHVQS